MGSARYLGKNKHNFEIWADLVLCQGYVPDKHHAT
jgi:hypothetical protein